MAVEVGDLLVVWQTCFNEFPTDRLEWLMLLVTVADLMWTGGFFLDQDTWYVVFSTAPFYRPNNSQSDLKTSAWRCRYSPSWMTCIEALTSEHTNEWVYQNRSGSDLPQIYLEDPQRKEKSRHVDAISVVLGLIELVSGWCICWLWEVREKDEKYLCNFHTQ